SKRTAQQYATFRVPRLEWLRSAFAKMKIAVNVVFDRRHIELGEQLIKTRLLFVRHARTEGILITRHDDNRLHFVLRQSIARRVEAQTSARISRDFENAEVEALNRLKK